MLLLLVVLVGLLLALQKGQLQLIVIIRRVPVGPCLLMLGNRPRLEVVHNLWQYWHIRRYFSHLALQSWLLRLLLLFIYIVESHLLKSVMLTSMCLAASATVRSGLHREVDHCAAHLDSFVVAWQQRSALLD